MKRLIAPVLLTLSLTLPPLSAQAHRSWLLPSATLVNGAKPVVTLDASTSDDLFQTDAFALKLDGLVITAPDGSKVPPEDVAVAKQRAAFDLTLSQTGVYRIAVVADTVMGSYVLNEKTQRFRGTAAQLGELVPAGAQDVKCVHLLSRIETWVTHEAPAAPLTPAGAGLEIIPLGDPSAYVTGEAASFRAYLDGKPLAGLVVQVIPGGVRYRGDLMETDVTTDDKGEFTVTWPLAQMYWIGASFPPRVSEGQQGGPVESDTRYSTASTFEVMPF